MRFSRAVASRPEVVGRIALVLILWSGLPLLAATGGPIGQPVADWEVEHWINSPPLQLPDLIGRVVLIRWWTGPACPYCTSTAPALRELDRDFSARGLQVIAFYHHKGRLPLSLPEVQRMAHDLGFTFPVAIDPEWKTLRKWWLDDNDSGWTSVSFLIDARGVLRYVHPGGSFPLGSPEYARIRSRIQSLLEE